MAVTINAKGTSIDQFQVGKGSDGLVKTGTTQFKTPKVVPTEEGSLYWDSADGNKTLSLVMAGGNAVQQVGQETYYRIKASSAITEGQVVMFTGTVGASGALTGAPASGLVPSTASYVMGVATENIALNGWGYVTGFGLVRNINTTGGAEAWVDGQILYYNPSVAGGLSKNVPVTPNAKIQVCSVVHAAANGSLFVRPSFGGELGQFEGDVNFSSLAAGQLMVRNETNTNWENSTGLVWDETNDRLGVGVTTPLTNFDMGQDPLWTIGTSPTPTAVASDTGGTVAAGTYYFKVVASFKSGGAAGGVESNAATVTTSTGSVTLSWTHTPGAVVYSIYRTTTSGTYTSPSFIGQTSKNSFTWVGTNVSSGGPSTIPVQQAYAAKFQINDIYTAVDNNQPTFRLNRVSALSSTDADTGLVISALNTTHTNNTSNHGLQRAIFAANTFSGSGTVGAMQGVIGQSLYYGSGSSVGAISGGLFQGNLAGNNTITVNAAYGSQSSVYITFGGRVTNAYGAYNLAQIYSSGDLNPTAGTLYGTYSYATHSSIGKTVDNMYGVWGHANATANNGAATRIQGGFFQASVGNGTGGATVTASTQRALEGWAFQNNTGVASNLEGGLFTATAYGSVTNEITGSKSIAENQRPGTANLLCVGARMYALNYQTVDTTYGAMAEVQHNANTYMYSARGLSSAVINTSGGTIDDARGYNVSVLNNSGTINNAYGLYIGTIGGTNKWGIYQEDITARNYFGGNLSVGEAGFNDAKLNVQTNTSGIQSVLALQNYANNNGDGTALDFYRANGLRVRLTAIKAASGNETDFALSAFDGSNVVERLRVNGLTGSVGIGTDSPSAKLHVASGVTNTTTPIFEFDSGDVSTGPDPVTARFRLLLEDGESGGPDVSKHGLVFDGTPSSAGPDPAYPSYKFKGYSHDVLIKDGVSTTGNVTTTSLLKGNTFTLQGVGDYSGDPTDSRLEVTLTDAIDYGGDPVLNSGVIFNNRSTYGGDELSKSYRFKGVGYDVLINEGRLSANIGVFSGAANSVVLYGTATGLYPCLSAEGTDANVALEIRGKGTGAHLFTTSSNKTQFKVYHTANSVNWLGVTGGATTAAPTITANGSDTNIDIKLIPKGTGSVVQSVSSTAATLSTNSSMSFQLVSNTSLKILVRGTDGVTRSTTLTLS